MAITVFYSWQSDRGQNRGFIRSALDAAAAELREELALTEAPREVVVDQDTQGLPGSPAIAEAILTKIRSADIFIADLTFIDEDRDTGTGRRTPNPNVMLEYGYALHALGDARIIGVFNEEFGLPRYLPFDLAHRRWPIRFNLSKNRQAEKKQLTSSLKQALKSIASQFAEQGASATTSPPFAAAVPADGVGRLRSEGDPLCVFGRFDSTEVDQAVHLPKGPYMFLRLVPTSASVVMGEVQTYRIAQGNLQPMQGMRNSSGWSTGRHQTGSVVFFAAQSGPKVALDASELFLTGEIWGNEFYLLNPARDRAKEDGFPFIPTGAVEEILIDSFVNYVLIARQHLKIPLPLQVKAGLAGVRNFRLAVKPEYFGYNDFAGRILRDNVVYEALLNDWSVDPFDFLKPLFEKMYDSAGEIRPNFRTAGRRQR